VEIPLRVDALQRIDPSISGTPKTNLVREKAEDKKQVADCLGDPTKIAGRFIRASSTLGEADAK
jgi:hypothetical protein